MGVVTIRGGGVTLESSYRVLAITAGDGKKYSTPTADSKQIAFTVAGLPSGAKVTRAYVTVTVDKSGSGTFTLGGAARTVMNLPLGNGNMFPNGLPVTVSVGFRAKPTGDEEGSPIIGRYYKVSCRVTAAALVLEYESNPSGGGGGGNDTPGQSGSQIVVKGPGRAGRGFHYFPEGTADFSRNGLPLRPTSCVVTGEENGDFAAQMDLLMEDGGAWEKIGRRGLVRMPAPARQTPYLDPEVTGNAQYDIVTPGTERGYLYLYDRATSMKKKSRNLGRVNNGERLVLIGETEGENGEAWLQVTSERTGVTGYCEKEQTALLESGVSAPGREVQLQERDQIFRVVNVRTDDASGVCSVELRHVFYDLGKAVLIGEECNMEDVPIAEALRRIAEGADHPLSHTLMTNCTGNITGDFRGQNVVEALMDPEGGVIAQVKGYLSRDNWDVWILQQMGEDRGVRVEHGRNCTGAECTWDSEPIANRIVAVMDEQYSVHDDPNRGADEEILTVKRNYKKEDGTAQEQAMKEFEEGLAAAAFDMTVDFVLLAETTMYAQYAGMQQLHLGDEMRVTLRQGKFRARMRGYEYDCILQKYNEVKVGATSVERSTGSVTGYQVSGVSAGKLIGPVQGSQLADGSVSKIKVDTALIGEMNAEAVKAVAAEIIRLHAGNVTTDELYAALAGIANASIGTADIDFARIKDMVTDTAIITKGVGDELYIARLAVTDANMVSLTAGELIVKGKDGGFYALTVDDAGNVQTVRKEVENDDIGDLSINAGEKLIEGSVTAATLNVQDIFADSAIIRGLIAAHIDVDTLFAREATLNAINALDIRGNRYLSISVDGLRQEIQAAADQSGQQMTISFDTGNAIEKERQSLTARVHLWKNGTDITGDIPLSAFTWTKDSDQETDAAWGTENAGKTAVILTRADIGKSCRISCTVDAGSSYGMFEIVNGELLFTGTDIFRLENGDLYGPDAYVLKDGTVYRKNAPGKMTVTSTAFDHSVLENSGIAITDSGVHVFTGGAFTVDSGNFIIDKNGNVTVTGTVTAEDGLIGGWKINPGSLSSGEGTKHVRLSTADATYAIWAGAEDAGNAPFRVARDGTVYLTKLYVTDENGEAQPNPVNLRTSYWKMDKAYARAVQTLTVDGDTLTITLNDGTSINFKKAGFSALELRQGDPQGRGVWVYTPADHTYNVQKTVYAYDNNEYTGLYSTVNETSGTEAYQDGKEDGYNSVSISGITRQAADSFTGGDDYGTTVYIRATASNGKTGTESIRVSGVSAYNLGVSAGHKTGYDEGYAAGYEAAKNAVTVEGDIFTLRNTAPNYFYAQGNAVAYVDGVQVATDTFSKSVTINVGQ